MMANPDFDIGIIGGGPGGAAMASYLAKAGLKCVVFERELFPRPHVGESLVPSANRVLKELGFLEKMEEYRFPHKFGAVWTTSTSTHAHDVDWEGLGEDGEAAIRFEEREQPGIDRKYTYHVDRGLFDLLFLQHANQLGAEVYEGVRVQGVDFSEPHTRVLFKMGRKDLSVTTRMVVDASGRNTLLGNQLKLKVRDPVFDQYAIHTWFEDYDRSLMARKEGQEDYIFIHFLPLSNTWVWQIPITDSITSIGCVMQKKNFPKAKEARGPFFWDTVATRPELHEGLRAAAQIRGFKEEGDYSYAMKQICGDRFVLIGDAARFVDPIFSTGVSIAMNSARFASRDIIGAAERGHFGRDAFDTFESTIRRGTRNWYNFISVYYRLNVLFTYYIRDPKHRLDVLKLLQGDVYDEDEPEVLVKMREKVLDIERRPEHPWNKLLGDLTNQAFSPLF
jgi:FADH2 O2-dependent halogenase